MSIVHDSPTFYGVATVGPKGQIVIPVEARHRLDVKPGDKIVIVGPTHKPQFIGICAEKTFNEILQKIDNSLNEVKAAFGKEEKAS